MLYRNYWCFTENYWCCTGTIDVVPETIDVAPEIIDFAPEIIDFAPEIIDFTPETFDFAPETIVSARGMFVYKYVIVYTGTLHIKRWQITRFLKNFVYQILMIRPKMAMCDDGNYRKRHYKY